MLDLFSYIRHKLCALLVLMLLLFAGCRNIELPYNFSKINGSYQYSPTEPLPPELQFALLTWYLAVNPDLPADLHQTVLKVQEECARAVNLRLAEKIVQRATPFARLDAQGGLKFDSTYFADRLDWQDNARLLSEVRDLLSSRKLELSDLGDLGELQKKDHSEQLTAFRSWFIVNSVVMAETAPLNRQELLAMLDKIQDVLTLKRHLLDSLSEAKALLAAGNGLRALDLLDKASRKFTTDSSLATIGDVKTLAEFEQFRKELPAQLLDLQLRSLEESLRQIAGNAAVLSSQKDFSLAENKLLVQEKLFAESSRIWRQDSRFQTALTEAADRLSDIARKAAELRTTIWTGEAKMLANRKEYLTASSKIQRYQRNLAEKTATEFEFYAFFKNERNADQNLTEMMEAELRNAYRSIMPLALADYCRLTEKAVNLDNHFGLGFLLGRSVEKMLATNLNASPQPNNDTADKIRTISELTTRARELLLGNGGNQPGILQHAVRIRAMTAATAGLGLTYSRDLEHTLGEILQRSQVLCPLTSIGSGDAEPGSNDFLVYSGVVAAFDSTEQLERSSMRSLLRYGPVQKLKNPDFLPDPPQHASIKQTSPYLYRQEEIEQVITSKEIERIAHVRVFFNLKGPGVAELLEINQIYSRKFLSEQSHLFNDVKVKRIIEVYDQSELSLPQAAPELVNDRIWSSGEMHDFARKDSLMVLALKIFCQVQSFPLTLATQAERYTKEGNLSRAAEFWGQCLAICEMLKTDSDILSLLQLESLPQAACFPADLQALRERHNDLSTLQKNVFDKALQVVDAYAGGELKRK
jgi:hypothetical protein